MMEAKMNQFIAIATERDSVVMMKLALISVHKSSVLIAGIPDARTRECSAKREHRSK